MNLGRSARQRESCGAGDGERIEIERAGNLDRQGLLGEVAALLIETQVGIFQDFAFREIGHVVGCGEVVAVPALAAEREEKSGKRTRQPRIPTRSVDELAVLEIIHGDVHGPLGHRGASEGQRTQEDREESQSCARATRLHRSARFYHPRAGCSKRGSAPRPPFRAGRFRYSVVRPFGAPVPVGSSAFLGAPAARPMQRFSGSLVSTAGPRAHPLPARCGTQFASRPRESLRRLPVRLRIRDFAERHRTAPAANHRRKYSAHAHDGARPAACRGNLSRALALVASI